MHMMDTSRDCQGEFRVEFSTFDCKHENLHIYSFGPAEFNSAGSQSQFSKGTSYLIIQNGRHLKIIVQLLANQSHRITIIIKTNSMFFSAESDSKSVSHLAVALTVITIFENPRWPPHRNMFLFAN